MCMRNGMTDILSGILPRITVMSSQASVYSACVFCLHVVVSVDGVLLSGRLMGVFINYYRVTELRLLP